MQPSWKEQIGAEVEKPYFLQLAEFLKKERETQTVFPPKDQVFTAFKGTPFDAVKVLILGQDPYHNAGQAHGLSFSVQRGLKPPPSLLNIYKELASDVGCTVPKHGHLIAWAEQGVFLLNATLTVRAHEPGSHQGKGWETFTDVAISKLSARERPLVFILWGRYAREKVGLIDTKKHLVIESAHPSPMSATSGFFGSRPFSRANTALESWGGTPINWQLPV
jgi:uracil-DNA glycosylase